jgi:hypothetical protein
LKKEELEEILLKFSYREENEREAQEAFFIFYREYSKYLSKVVYEAKKTAIYFYNDIVDIVVDNTFLKIYEKSLDFVINEEDSDSDVDKKMKGYLAVIAKNELRGLLNKKYCYQEHSLIIDDDESIFDPLEIEITEIGELSHNQKILQEVLMTFSERDRSILLSLYNCHEEGRNTPKETMAWLMKTHQTSDMNIRKIKSRCEKEIREYFEKNTTLKPLKR